MSFSPIDWLNERSSVDVAHEVASGGTGESSEESRVKTWIRAQLDLVDPHWFERLERALISLAEGDHEPAVIAGHEIRSIILPIAHIARARGEAPWRTARDTNAEILRSVYGSSAAPEPAMVGVGHIPVGVFGPSTRARGAGRPAARSASSPRAGPSSDDDGLADDDEPARRRRLSLFRAWRRSR